MSPLAAVVGGAAAAWHLSVCGRSVGVMCATGGRISPAAYKTTHAAILARPLLRDMSRGLTTRALALQMNVAADPSDELKITPFWRQRLRQLTKPAVLALIPSLSPSNVLCWENQNKISGSLVEFAVEAKARHPDMVLLIRVGDFYEAFGLDALMLVEYAGLNPMGRKARAGCPVSNVQATLDGLTGAGLTVAVYEEVAPANTAEGKYRRLKQRALSQIVSPASPTYIYEAVLSPHEIPYAEPPPYLGVASGATGYTAVIVNVDARTYKVHERLSLPALHALLASRGFAPPLLVGGAAATGAAAANGVASGGKTLGVASSLASALQSVSSSSSEPMERRTLTAGSTALFPSSVVDFAASQAQVRPDEFRRLSSPTSGLDAPPRPLYASTATQIGLIPSPGIPDLPRALLPPHAPAACVNLLRRWLLLPPRPSVADAMREACVSLAALNGPLPACRPLPVGKLVNLLLARQANAPLFDEARRVLDAMCASLDAPHLNRLNSALLDLVAEEAGLRLGQTKLVSDGERARELIASTVADQSSHAAMLDAPTSDPHGAIPSAFFRKNEGFRGLLADGVAADEFAALDDAAAVLCDAVSKTLSATGATLLHDTVNNCVHFRKKPRARKAAKAAEEEEEEGGGGTTAVEMEPARDRNRRLLSNRFTTSPVREATEAYLGACEDATRAARAELQRLCDDLNPLLPALVTAAHWSLFTTTLSHHVARALPAGWGLPALRSASDGDRSVVLDEVWPYWMEQSRAVANSFSWEGVWLLTAPNMAGKSSLMRGITVAALLANAGLYAPAVGGEVPRFDAFFLRTASFDVPAEGKSAFAMEMDDVRVMTSECSPRSLIMLDEIGRGTSSKEGSALGTALLEWLDAQGMPAVFATHLHEIEDHLARSEALSSLSRRCLRVEEGGNQFSDGIRMTYQLMEGTCNNSLALHVARRAGLPPSVLSRAEEIMAEAAAVDSGRLAADEVLAGRQDNILRWDGGGAADSEATADSAIELADAATDAAQLDAAKAVLAESCGYAGTDTVVHVGANWQPPPRLAGRSCVYVLQLRPSPEPAPTAPAPGAELAARRPPTALYVGESDSIERRLRQHRRTHGAANVDCVVCEVESKTRAVEIEADMIRRLKELGLGRVTNVANA